MSRFTPLWSARVRGKNVTRSRLQKAPARRQLLLESLEERALLACTVTTTADAGLGSLRACITAENGSSVPGMITFNITGGGIHTITPSTPLPALTNPAGVTIDGTTQPGLPSSHCNTLATGNDAVLYVVLDGSMAGSVGLDLRSANNVVRGLVVNRFRFGIIFDGSGATGNRVECSFVGTNATGTAAVPNGDGVFFSAGAHDNLLGGTTPAARNLISGNQLAGVGIADPGTANNQVQNNYVGTNALGTGRIPNGRDAVVIFNDARNNLVGGTQAGARNVLSGNNRDGVLIGTTGNVVQGNYIGTDASGIAALPNSGPGVVIDGSSNTVGGTDRTLGVCNRACNLISGNDASGVYIGGSSNLVQGNFIGTDVMGSSRGLGNQDGVVTYSGSNNILGGTAAGAGNLISANRGNGIITTGGNLIAGNYIGTNASGTVALGNMFNGIIAFNNGNTIGGTTAAARNVISGNGTVGSGIETSGVRIYFGSYNLVAGNYIGTDAAGTLPLPNHGNGVEIDQANFNTIGGTDHDAGVCNRACNVISGNDDYGDRVNGNGVKIYNGASDNLVAGNFIGTDRFGTSLGFDNTKDGVLLDAPNNTVGGTYHYDWETCNRACNLISGNGGHGVEVQSNGSGEVVQGNFIGTNVAGTGRLPNGVPNGDGVLILGSHNVVGGPTPGAGNLISGNSSSGVEIGLEAMDNLVAGNYIGTDRTGTCTICMVGNSSSGVLISGTNNTVGGTTSWARNLISDNHRHGVEIGGPAATDNLVAGNYIGTDRTGNSPLGNSLDGVWIDAPNNTVGGTTAGARNVISANGRHGVNLLHFSGNLVEGNYIGTKANGSEGLRNAGDGVAISDSTHHVIGGMTPGARNVISANGQYGVEIASDTDNILVAGNYIGTDNIGSTNLGNTLDGVRINGWNNTIGGAYGTTPGGPCTGACNLISYNMGHGVGINAGGNLLQGNDIGSNGGDGVSILYIPPGSGGDRNTIGGTATGEANLIHGNGGNGVGVDTHTGNDIRGNSIFGHTSGSSIVLLNNGNQNQVSPTLTSAVYSASMTQTIIAGTMAGPIGHNYELDFFADPSGSCEAPAFLGFLRLTLTGSPMNFTFASPLNLVGQNITATATDVTLGSPNYNDTSPLSNCVTVTMGSSLGPGALGSTATPIDQSALASVVAAFAGPAVTSTVGADKAIATGQEWRTVARASDVMIHRSRGTTSDNLALAVLSGRRRKPAPSAVIAADVVFAQPSKLWLSV